MSVNARWRLRSASYTGLNSTNRSFRSSARTTTRRCGSVTASGRMTTASSTVKTAVVAPMPSASDSKATAVNAGLARRTRTAYRRSCIV